MYDEALKDVFKADDSLYRPPQNVPSRQGVPWKVMAWGGESLADVHPHVSAVQQDSLIAHLSSATEKTKPIYASS